MEMTQNPEVSRCRELLFPDDVTKQRSRLTGCFSFRRERELVFSSCTERVSSADAPFLLLLRNKNNRTAMASANSQRRKKTAVVMDRRSDNRYSKYRLDHFKTYRGKLHPQLPRELITS